MAAPACPSCSRPVQLGKPTCMYCGAPTSGAAAAVPPPPSPEPATVASADDLQTLMKLAMDHAVQGRPAESQRIMGKVFTEVSGKDIQDLFDFALPLWSKSLQGSRHAAALPAFEAAIRTAVSLGVRGHFSEAFQRVLPVLQAVGADPAQHAMLPLLCIGLKGAAAFPQPAADPYPELVRRAVECMVAPDRRAEGMRLLEQALALVPDPPQSDRDKERRARLSSLIEVYRRLADGSATVVSAPPPAPKPSAGKTWDPTRIVEPGGAGHNWSFGK